MEDRGPHGGRVGELGFFPRRGSLRNGYHTQKGGANTPNLTQEDKKKIPGAGSELGKSTTQILNEDPLRPGARSREFPAQSDIWVFRKAEFTWPGGPVPTAKDLSTLPPGEAPAPRWVAGAVFEEKSVSALPGTLEGNGPVLLCSPGVGVRLIGTVGGFDL